MRVILFILILFYFGNIHAQHENKQTTDSIYFNLLQKAFKYSQTGKNNEAMRLGNEALEYAKRVGTDSIEARAYNIIAMAFMNLKDNKAAFDHLTKSKKIYLKINDSSKLISIFNNIGVFYGDNKQVDSSNVYYKKAMKIAEALNTKKRILLLSYNIGYNYGIYKANYKKSMSYLNQSLSLIEYSTNPRINGKLYRAIGYVKKELKDYESAHANFDRSIEIYKANGYINDLVEVYNYKIEAYKAQNDLESTNNYLFELIKIKDSVNLIEREDLAKEIEVKYKLKDNNDKIKFIEKEKIVQQKLLDKSKRFNWLLTFLMILLLFTAYWIFIKNKELKKARDKAEQLTKVKSNFYSEISHELRTPLYAVIELSGLLLKENVNVKHKEYLESLKFSGNHLLSLINNVLQLNKVESGELKIENSNFDLKALISNIIDSLEYALRDSGNSIVLKYDDTIPSKMVGDSLKLSQVLINLISNAIKFTNNGTIEVIMSRIKANENEGEVNVFFKIKDNGIGISKEKQERVFEDYYQEHAKNDNSYKGTGLGLSIVKRTLEAMNSKIRVESEAGKGAAFFFDAVFENEKDLEVKDEAYLKQLETIKAYKLLIVDDNKINQLVTKKILDQLDVKSDVTDSGAKALELVRENDYDCILMDLHMPKMDGYEASRRIRAINKKVAIVALTAASSEEIEKKINAVSMYGYILKPFLTNDFVATIVRAVKKNNM